MKEKISVHSTQTQTTHTSWLHLHIPECLQQKHTHKHTHKYNNNSLTTKPSQWSNSKTQKQPRGNKLNPLKKVTTVAKWQAQTDSHWHPVIEVHVRPCLGRPRWRSWMRVRLETRRSWVRPPPRSATFFRGDWSWNIFYGHSFPQIQEGQLSVSDERMCKILVNR